MPYRYNGTKPDGSSCCSSDRLDRLCVGNCRPQFAGPAPRTLVAARPVAASTFTLNSSDPTVPPMALSDDDVAQILTALSARRVSPRARQRAEVPQPMAAAAARPIAGIPAAPTMADTVGFKRAATPMRAPAPISAAPQPMVASTHAVPAPPSMMDMVRRRVR